MAASALNKEQSSERIVRADQNLAQRRYFDSVAEVFTAVPPEEVLERLERIVSLSHLLEGETVLDVGSGTGVLIPIIARYKPARIIACDLSPEMLSILTRRFPKDAVETCLGDIKDVDLPDASIDVAFLNAVWPNVTDKPAALANLTRMLKKPGGRLVISHPEGKEFVRRLRDELPFPIDLLPAEGEVKALFEGYGLRVVTFLDETRLYLAVGERD